MQAGRKRKVSTCIPCYTRKQKCNRQYPCNHCTRRRKPEECIYTLPAIVEHSKSESQSDIGSKYGFESLSVSRESPNSLETDGTTANLYGLEDFSYHSQAPLPFESFGFFDGSKSNTAALLRTWDSGSIYNMLIGDKSIPSRFNDSIEVQLERMPHRQVLDFLVQYFVSELNWMKQLVHAQNFLMQYERWWYESRPLSIEDLELAVLILRVCSYAAQFLPSPSHTIDRICGLSLSDIRTSCNDVANTLSKVCLDLDWKGSVIRVQHMLFSAMTFSCEGGFDKFWDGIAAASSAAQKAGLHRSCEASGGDTVPDLETDTRRRTLCNLYILDSRLSRQLDLPPSFPEFMLNGICLQTNPMLQAGEVEATGSAPDLFTERVLQVQLARFWRSFDARDSEYDPTQGEQRFEQFCSRFLPNLPATFAFQADTNWDACLPKLPMKRHLLHIYILDSICSNFRPLLMLTQAQVARLAPYKQVLLQSQKRILAMAALMQLEAISHLHSSFSGSHVRFDVIIFNTFEAAVLLFRLYSDSDFLANEGQTSTSFLGCEIGILNREKLLYAAKKALGRLKMLGAVCELAACAAKAVQLLARATDETEYIETPMFMATNHGITTNGDLTSYFDQETRNWASLGLPNPGLMLDLLTPPDS